MVDAYLGIPKASQLMALSRSSSSSTANQQQTQAGVSFVTASSALLVNAVTGTLPEHQSLEPSLVRPKCSSILHLLDHGSSRLPSSVPISPNILRPRTRVEQEELLQQESGDPMRLDSIKP